MNRSFRRSFGWLLLAGLALACLWNYRPPRHAPESVGPPPATVPGVAAAPARHTNSPANADAEWNRWRAQLPAAKPALEDVTEWPANRAEAFEKFRSWQAQYRAAADKPALTAEGVALAQARRAAMARWIERDPEFALEQATGPDARRGLPAEVLAELERWIEGKGGLEVMIRCGPEVKPADQVTRKVRVDGEEFRAFVYGRRLGQTTKYDLPIHAVAVDGKLALHSSPVRQLEPGEARERGLAAQAIHLETGGEVASAAGALDAFAIETRLLQREAGRGPYPMGQTVAGRVPAGLPPGTAAFPPSPGWTLGIKRVLVIFVDFSDAVGALMTTNAAHQVMTNVNQFYLDNSQGQTSIQPTYFPITLRLPQTKAAYANLDPMTDLRRDSLAAARTYDQQNGNTGAFNPDNYDLDISVFTSITSANFGFAGLAFVGGKGCVVNDEFDLRVVSHELGHNYGLQHANRWDVTGTDPIDPAGTHNEYGDEYDMMGANNNNQAIHYSEWFKAYLGWLNTSNWRTAPTGGVYRLFRHDHTNASGIRGITAGQQSDRAYWLGYRRNLSTYSANSFGATNFLANGVEIRWGMQAPGITSDMTTGSRLLNFTPATANFTRHPLPIGQTFTDTNFNLSITPLSVGGTSPNEFIDLNISYTTAPVTITQNPTNQTVFAGSTVTFDVAVTGAGPITYQWTFNTVNIPGATSSNLTLVNVTTNQGGTYLVRVTNPGGTVNSQPATLVVLPVPLAPVITQNPTNLTVPVGSNATFTIIASGTAPLLYQWAFNGVNLPGATNTTLTLTNVQYRSEGGYSVRIQNSAGFTNSLTATLTVSSLGPVAHWRFDEAPGSPVAVDSVGNFDGTNSPTGAAFVPGGRVGNALSLDRAANGFANFGNILSFTSGDFTVSAWIKTAPGDPQQDANFLSKHQSGTVNGYLLSYSWGAPGANVANKAWFLAGNRITNAFFVREPVTSTTDVNNGGWHQLVGVYRAGSTTSIYVDGSPLEGSILSSPIAGGNDPFIIGGNMLGATVESRFSGLVDDVQVYNRALDDGEIDFLFQNPGQSIIGAPTIATPPQNATVVLGGTATFTVTNGGTAPFTYQWRFNGANLNGATSPTLTLNNVQTNQAGLYSVRVDNALGFATSTNATLTVLIPPFLTAPPTNLTVLAGSAATFSVVAGGTPPLAYQWRFNGTNLPGATSPSLLIPNAQFINAGSYSVIVGNPYGTVTSSNATLTVNSPPIITVQPVSRVASIASPIAFSVGQAGNAPFTWQWRFNGAAIAGATNASHTIPGVVGAHAGAYSVLVTNAYGFAASSNATLTVIPARVLSPWGASAGGFGSDAGNAVAVDASGNAFIAGYFTGAATFGTNQLVSAGARDGFLAKYNSAGQLLWVRRVGGPGFDAVNALALDTNGNCYLAGSFEGVAAFGSASLTNTSASSFTDGFVAKFDTGGTNVWARSLGVSGAHDLGNAVALDGAGNVFVAGQSVLTNFNGVTLTNHGRIFLAKYDSAGSPQWARKAGGGIAAQFDQATALAADTAGNVFLAGVFASASAAFDGVAPLANRGGADAFLARYDAAGGLQWVQQIGGGLDDRASGLAVDSAGNAYVVGEFTGTLQLPGTNLVTGVVDQNAFIARFDAAGVVNWARQAGGTLPDAARAVTVDRSDRVFVAGYFSGAAAFGAESLVSVGNTYDAFIARLDTNGNFTFAQQAGGDDLGGDIGLGVAADAAGNALLTGYFSGASALGSASPVSTGGEDIFLTRFNAFAGDAPPPLLVLPIAGQLRFSWSAGASSFILQTATNLLNPVWTDAVGSLLVETNELVMTNTPGPVNRFFRLRKP